MQPMTFNDLERAASLSRAPSLTLAGAASAASAGASGTAPQNHTLESSTSAALPLTAPPIPTSIGNLRRAPSATSLAVQNTSNPTPEVAAEESEFVHATVDITGVPARLEDPVSNGAPKTAPSDNVPAPADASGGSDSPSARTAGVSALPERYNNDGTVTACCTSLL